MKACNQCGKCCIKYSDGGLSVSEEEIQNWELFNPTIRNYVLEGEIWFNPETKQPLKLCPWLRKDPIKPLYSCDIYHDRPEDCRLYPTSISEMINDACEMIEIQDLNNPQKAQIQLDKLMADSRPALSLSHKK